MPYFSITLDGQIYLQNVGYFTTINIYANNVDEALNKAINKVRKNIFKNYKYYTNDFIITDFEKLDFWTKQTDYYFYNL
jgi:hypothetical protein